MVIGALRCRPGPLRNDRREHTAAALFSKKLQECQHARSAPANPPRENWREPTHYYCHTLSLSVTGSDLDSASHRARDDHAADVANAPAGRAHSCTMRNPRLEASNAPLGATRVCQQPPRVPGTALRVVGGQLTKLSWDALRVCILVHYIFYDIPSIHRLRVAFYGRTLQVFNTRTVSQCFQQYLF